MSARSGAKGDVGLTVLSPGAQLHLVVWHRLDPDMHRAGLELMGSLLRDPVTAASAMLLLRPAGRSEPDYRGFDGEFADHTGRLPGVPQEWGFRCCELWAQVTESGKEEVWRRLRSFASACSSGGAGAKAWRRHRSPGWQPLSGSFLDCRDYCESSPAFPVNSHPRYADARVVLDRLPGEEAFLLKTIWHKASVVIADRWVGEHSSVPLDPCNPRHRAAIAGLLDDILAPFAPPPRGLSELAGEVDPSAFAVSHMAAFAVNAVTQVTNHVYHVEALYGDGRLTHPYLFQNRDDYIRTVRAAMC